MSANKKLAQKVNVLSQQLASLNSKSGKSKQKKRKNPQGRSGGSGMSLMPLVSGIHGFRSGVKWPDTDSSPSVAFSTMTNLTASPIGGVRFMRVYPNRVNDALYISPTISGSAVTDWGTGTSIEPATNIDTNFAGVRLVSASIAIKYIGNGFNNSGLITVTESTVNAHLSTAAPLRQSDITPVKTFGRFDGGVVITCRRNSKESEHYNPPASSLDGDALDAWSCYTIFIEGCDINSPQAFEFFLIQNWEALPGADMIGALFSSPPSPDKPSVRSAVANQLRAIDPTSYGHAASAAMNWLNTAGYVGTSAASALGGYAAKALQRPRPQLHLGGV